MSLSYIVSKIWRVTDRKPQILSRAAMLARYMLRPCLCICLSVCPAVYHRSVFYQNGKRIITHHANYAAR